MAVGEAGGRAARAMAPREAGFLALLVAANLVAVTVDILLSALYPSLAACYARPVETLVLLGTPRALAQLGVLPLGALSDRVGRGRVLAGGL
ncbi:MAG: MFS transporter, partial [Anaerolineae bacterium]|nr:MFS transporter [Anaerolineae bacterium]